MKTCKCTQCGATNFDRDGDAFLRCTYCESLYRMREPPSEPSDAQVVIRKGANVVFGKSSNVSIRANLNIESGANVQFLGKLELVKKAPKEKVDQARSRLLELEKVDS